MKPAPSTPKPPDRRKERAVDKLRPCPFCGGEAALGDHKDHTWPYCTKCLVGYWYIAEVQKWDAEIATTAWNRRFADADA